MAITFTGANETVINLGNPSHLNFIPNTDEFSLMGWVRVTSGNVGTLISKRYSTFYQYQLGVTTGGYPFILVGTGTANTGTIAIDDGEWHHISGVNFDVSGTLFYELFIDGILNKGGLLSGSLTSTAGVLIGGRHDLHTGDFGYLLTGDAADVRAYNRVLSAEEHETIYACRGSDGIVDGLVGRWPLNEGPPGVNVQSFFRF